MIEMRRCTECDGPIALNNVTGYCTRTDACKKLNRDAIKGRLGEKYKQSQREASRRYQQTRYFTDEAYRTKVNAATAIRRNKVRNHYKAMVNEIKLAAGCERCGYSENAYALDFDHINPETKAKSVSALVNDARSINPSTESGILAEVAKCRVLCANCHRVWTWDSENF